MNGQLPEIYWFVFWIGVVLLSFGAAYLARRAAHERALKALAILKMYAEKGAEPPKEMMDRLAGEVFDAEKVKTRLLHGRAALMQAFIGFLFAACVVGGLYYWLLESDGPGWALHASRAAEVFFAIGAFGLLLAALFSREK